MGYQVAEQDQHRKPGPQNPSRYPQIGPHYQYYGEQAGYLYDPWRDRYVPDPKAVAKYEEEMGVTEPTPGLLESVAPLAFGALALGGGQALGKELPGLFSLGKEEAAKEVAQQVVGGGGVSSGSGVAAGIGEVAPNAVSQGAAGSVAPSAGGGLLGPTGGLATYGVPAAVAAGTYLGGQAAYDMYKGRDANPLGRGILGIATGGLSELAKATGLLGRKTTGQYREERRSDVGQGNAAWGNYFAEEKTNPLQDGKFHGGLYDGEKWSFEKAKQRALADPKEFAGVVGNAETFGDEWFQLSDAQRDDIVRRFVAEDLYHSDKGDVLIADRNQERAREIFNEVKSGAASPTVPSTAPKPIPGTPSGGSYNGQITANINGQSQNVIPRTGLMGIAPTSVPKTASAPVQQSQPEPVKKKGLFGLYY